MPDNPAVDGLAQLAVGNDQLIMRPGLLQQLQQRNATPQQAGMVNSYLVGLDAHTQVKLARMGGAKLDLTTMQQRALDAIGESYSDVSLPKQGT